MFYPISVISQHRLPKFYRYLFAGLWLLPPILLIAALAFAHQSLWFVVHPFTVVYVLILLIPAIYVWREGVDILPGGILVRMRGRNFYATHTLSTWECYRHNDQDVFCVWNKQGERVLHCPVRHLSEFHILQQNLYAVMSMNSDTQG